VCVRCGDLLRSSAAARIDDHGDYVLQARKSGHVLVRTSGRGKASVSVAEIGYVRRSEISSYLLGKLSEEPSSYAPSLSYSSFSGDNSRHQGEGRKRLAANTAFHNR
jgi:hypothetical protein